MQNAKDSFYEAMRDRLASLNPDRTVVVRGVTRPALVVSENETQSVAAAADCFHVCWTGIAVTPGPLPLVTLTCEIRYATAGNSWAGGLDRGRVLAAMDGELQACVRTYPQNAWKRDYTGLGHGGTAQLQGTKIWWSDLVFAPATTEADRMERVATVQVMSFVEAGEL